MGIEHVDIVPGSFSDKTTKDVEFTAWGSGSGKCMAIPWKRGRGRGGWGSDTRFVDHGWWKKDYPSSSPRK